MFGTRHSHDTRAIVCAHVVDAGLPVRHAIHEAGGEWQFLCGGDDHRDAATARIACFGCLMRNDPTLRGVEDIAPGFEAWRETGDGRWLVYPTEDE